MVHSLSFHCCAPCYCKLSPTTHGKLVVCENSLDHRFYRLEAFLSDDSENTTLLTNVHNSP